MKSWPDTFGVIVEIALRNLFANRWKTLIVGGICGFAALLIVVGSSILESVDQALQRSITGSIAGHIQVYSAESKDALEIMGDAYVDVPDIAPLEDFAKLRRTLLAVPNVAAVVPMGFSDAVASSSSAIDQALSDLRETTGLVGQAAGVELLAKYDARKQQVRRIVGVLDTELRVAGKISETAVDGEASKNVGRATSDAFWADFDANPMSNIEFLESRVAPLATGADALSLRYVGTDPAAFAKAFEHMRVVDGSPIPVGRRGFLFSKSVYEEQIKLRAARGLDYIKRRRDERNARIADDTDLKRIVEENVNGVNELLLQLDSNKTQSFRFKLQGFLGSQEHDVAKLLASFFDTNDSNFDGRFAFFYRTLAPELILYRVRIGDMLTIRAVTRNGYVRSANVRVYGTYVFTGLEKSPQAGAINMMDLVTFRELYGFITAEQEQEISAMHASAGAQDIERENAEDKLFGNKAQVDTVAAQAGAATATDQFEAMRGTRARQESKEQASYAPEQLEQGSVLNAAVIVADESRIPETIAGIERAGKDHGLPLKAISWEKSSGLLGQFVTLMRGILFAAVLIIFVVALVVLNNALVMATLDRVPEIGALRAIGAQRSFVFGLLIVESVVIGLTSGGVGALLGGLVSLLVGKVGIPAGSEVMTVFFSGQRLFPVASLQQLGLALATVVAVSSFSGVYPAWLAMRVSPRQAMSTEE